MQIPAEEINAWGKEGKLKMLSRIFGQRRDEVKGEWRKKHIGLLNVLSPNSIVLGDKIGKNELGLACGSMGVKRGLYVVLVRKSSERNHFVDTG